MVSVAKILELIPDEGSLEIKKLEKMLKLTKKLERTRLDIAIKALSKIGLIQYEGEENIKSISEYNYIRAKIRCSSKGFCFAVRDDGEEDIYIREQYLNHAWHGDKVLIQIEKEGMKRRSPEGSVVCILERTKKRLLAYLEKIDELYYARALDERILSKIELESLEDEYKKESDNILEVEIVKYPIAQYPAVGRVVRELSLNNGFKGDVEIIKTKFSIIEEENVPRVSPKKIQDKHRVDLTSQSVINFKSWKCEDSPPQLSIFAEPSNGGVKVWVHVPTIAERISYGSKLDLWLRRRAESRCLGNKWINLLSKSLIDESKFTLKKTTEAITLEMDVDKEGNIDKWSFYLSKIKPDVEINDDILNEIANRKATSRTIPAKLKPFKKHLSSIETIIHLCKILNEKAISLGQINIEYNISPIENLFDNSYINPGLNNSYAKYSFNPSNSNSIISSISTTANRILFNHLRDLKLRMLYLESKEIDNNHINELIKSAVSLDTKVELNNNGLTDIHSLLKTIKNSPNQRVIEKILTNIIPDKKFSLYDPLTEPSHIDNINQNFYLDEAPWTSPTINYSDIANQFLLISIINSTKEKFSKKTEPNNNPKLAENIDTRKDYIDIKDIINSNFIEYLNDERIKSKSLRNGLLSIVEARSILSYVGSTLNGVITGVQSYGVFVELDSFKAEGLAHVSTLDDDWYEYRSRQNMLIGRKNKKTYQLGNKITVNILSVDLLKNQIDLEVVNEREVSSLEDIDNEDT